MLICVKDEQTLDEWRGLHPHLRDLFDWLSAKWPAGHDIVITRIQGPPIAGESGVHQTRPHRALDIRTSEFPYAEAKKLERNINAAWEYDPARPERECALYHDAGSGYHLHVQVHESTRKRPTPRMDET